MRSGSSGRGPAGQGSSLTSPPPSPSEGRHAVDETSTTAVLEMSSTDSAGSARASGGGPSCGLVSSLFPSSCRGRAEAFARRLHRRLTSLGGENGSPERDVNIDRQPHETSWLHPSSSGNRAVISTNNGTTNHVLQRQPRHSPESDLFFDFDVELENGPGSPAEEATAAELAHLLMNPEILKANHHDACHCSPSGTKAVPAPGLHQDTETGCMYVSPINGTPPDSDSSEIFFDPESSDTEKPKSEAYFDPITTTSDSEVTSNLSNCPAKARISSRRTDKNIGIRICEDTSESESCSSRRKSAPCENGDLREELVCSSEDSLNGRSSQETTSPSHESLWSTFDDSTVSLQDESPPRFDQPDQIIPHNRLPKSHSDSELPSNGPSALLSNKLDRWHEEDENESNEVDFVRVWSEEVIRNGKDFAVKDDVHNDTENSFDTEDDEQESAESTESKMTPSECSSQLKMDDTIASDTDTDPSTYSSTINVPVMLTLECPTGDRVIETSILKNEVELQIDKIAQSNNSEDDNNDDDDGKMRLLLTKLSSSPSAKEEEEESSSLEQESQSETVEEEEERPQRIRRCSSLKTGKTPPGTPGRKKIVRFADVLGLDLAAVRTFLDEIPRIPNSAYSDLVFQKDDFFQKDSSPVSNALSSVGNGWGDCYSNDNNGRRGSMPLSRKMERMLVPLFQQPGGMANFLDLVRERRVCLENVLVQNPTILAIQGTVRVINLDFHKSVHIRYTLNSWRNFSDLQATYVPNSCDGFSDKFSFVLYCHTLLIGQRLEFAVRFQCKGTQYWDNNGGANYCFQCLPGSSPVSYIPITAGESSRHTDWSPMFY
ncbi:glycogen-binding subunit 76A isoform X2 [Odontomachus brunneus]|uniref:glycogen-binding subunit 76A isoform X2 n=1 Tax=Odontomachus brunneus TaxID=486640 RepID=UPI0013F2A712|nr:glycogen-binding subunit 76A isoform X2 [Odontomachus brunneus]